MESSHRGPTVLTVTVVMLCVSTVFVAARLVSRIVIVKHVTGDDYLITIGWALAFGVSFVVAFATHVGLGRRDVDIKEEWILPLRKCEYVFSVLYNPALLATKSSLLVFYLRMSRATNKFFRIVSYATLALVNIAGVVLTLLNIFQCHPISQVFNMDDDAVMCIPLITLYLASAPVNIITDVIILVLPLPILTGMQMPQRQKTILVITFALGIFVTVVDVIRIYYLQQAMMDVLSSNQSATRTNGLGNETDFAYFASFSLMWSAVEVNVGLVCACIPTLKPLVKKILPILLEPPDHHCIEKIHTAPTTELDTRSREKPPPRAELLEGTSPVEGEAANQLSSETMVSQHQQAETDMLDFITVQDMDSSAIGSRNARQASTIRGVYFGFVNIRRPKCMLDLSTRDSWKYCTAVTILFFLWGFSYGLLNGLNTQIVTISHGSAAQGVGLLSAYWSAYLFGPLTLGWYALTKGEFKTTFIAGLCVYGTGTLMFWPSAVLVSFPGFIVSNFVTGFGLAVLETAANPFLVLCGPPQYGEMRLLLAQGVQGVASVVSQLIANHVFFNQVVERPTLISVQWAYLAVALFSVILTLFFYYMPLPEATDEELQRAAQSRSLPLNRAIMEPQSSTHIVTIRVVIFTLSLGVFAQFLYVAAQETVNLWFSPLLMSPTSVDTSGANLALTASNYSLIGHSAFAISRFLAGALCLYVRPRHLLFASLLGAMVLSLVTTALPSSTVAQNPNTMAGLVIGVYFFEGPVFPLIYAIALRGLGRVTKRGAVMVTAGTSGGAVGPWILYGIQRAIGVRRAFWVVTVALGLGCLFPVYLAVVKRARVIVDWDSDGDEDGEEDG